MKNVLWSPSDYHYTESNIAKFIFFVNKRHQQNIKNYDDLYAWSISDSSSFWNDVSNFCDIKFSSSPDSILNKKSTFIESSWFDGARLNFAENLLKYRDDMIAIEYFCEDQVQGKITYKGVSDAFNLVHSPAAELLSS